MTDAPAVRTMSLAESLGAPSPYAPHMLPCPVLDAIRQLHVRVVIDGVSVCRHCGELSAGGPAARWPCLTFRAVVGAVR